MGEKIFNCEDIRNRLKQFLEDLLQEDEYLAFTRHCEQCEQCEKYVSSIGTLSNQVRELGEIIEVPADFAATVRFRITTPPPAKRRIPPVHVPMAMVLAVAAILLACAPGIFLLKIWRAEKSRIATNVSMPAPGAAVVQKKELEPVAVPVVPVVEEAAAPVVNSLAAVPVNAVGQSSKPATPVVLKPLHWGVTIADGDDGWITKTIEEMGITVEQKFPYLLVLSIPGEDVRRLKAAMAMKFALHDYTDGAALEKGRKSKLTIFIEKHMPAATTPPEGTLVSLESSRNAGALHWSILMVLSKKEELIGIVRSSGGLPVYESGELYIFQVPSAGVKNIADKIRSLQGVSANIDAQLLDEAVKSEKVNLILYLMEQ
jgi:hypothetical protein